MNGFVIRVLTICLLIFGIVYFLWSLHKSMMDTLKTMAVDRLGLSDVSYILDDDEENTTLPLFTTLKGFDVWSPNCQIPEIKPFYKNIMGHVEKHSLVNCSDRPIITNIVRDSDGSHIMVFHEDLVKKYLMPHTGYYCCYISVTNDFFIATRFIDLHDHFMSTPTCTYFESNVHFNKEEQFIYVKCYFTSLAGDRRLFYQNMHSIVRTEQHVRSRLDNKPKKPEKVLSVYIIGIHAQSRLNIIRAMPKTYKYISKDWVELKGYNEISNSGIKNFFAFTGGLSNIKSIDKSDSNPLTRKNFIWSNLSNEGYVTSYACDKPEDNVLDRYNFEHNMTLMDYYQPYFIRASCQLFRPKSAFGSVVCAGPNYFVDSILNYNLDFSMEFKNESRLSFAWLSRFSDTCISAPTMIDDKFEAYFKKLESIGVYNDSLVVFLSDRGLKKENFRMYDFLSWENKLPFIFLRFPDWWKRQYATKYQNLVLNANRLSSPFDLYLTLQEVLGRPNAKTDECPECKSLFQPIPWDRKCEEAGIQPHTCTCHEHMSRWDMESFKPMAKYAINYINDEIAHTPKDVFIKGSFCSALAFKRILSILRTETPPLKVFNYEEVGLTIETSPNDALFEVSVRKSPSFNTDFEIVQPIRRIDNYLSRSRCVINKTHKVREFCACVYNILYL